VHDAYSRAAAQASGGRYHLYWCDRDVGESVDDLRESVVLVLG